MQQDEQRRFALVAGEASGDLLAGLLLDGLQARWPGFRPPASAVPRCSRTAFRAGGRRKSSRCAAISRCCATTREIAGIRRQLKARLLRERPDSSSASMRPISTSTSKPGLRSRGMKTVHFVCPSIWAWRADRVEKIRAAADHVLCIFPFEPALLAGTAWPAAMSAIRWPT
jgi:lipid-A-disaccharide synthase